MTSGTSPPMSAAEGFSGPEASRVVGITYRRLDYWARTGVVVPSLRLAAGSGTQRRYSFADLVELRTIKQLLDAGVGLPQVRVAIAALKARGMSPAETTLVSDGRTIYACESAEDVVDVLRKGQAVFAVAIDAVVEQLEGELAALHPAAEPEGHPGVPACAACRLTGLGCSRPSLRRERPASPRRRSARACSPVYPESLM